MLIVGYVIQVLDQRAIKNLENCLKYTSEEVFNFNDLP